VGAASRVSLIQSCQTAEPSGRTVVIGGALALVILPRLLQPALLALAYRKLGFAAQTVEA